MNSAMPIKGANKMSNAKVPALLECDICAKVIYEGYGFYIEEAENGAPVVVCRNCYEEAGDE